MDIKDLSKHLDETVGEVKSLVERQSEEIATIGKSSDETGAALAKATERLDEIKGEVDEYKNARAKDDERIVELEKRLNRSGFSPEEVTKTMGQLFTESKQFEAASAAGERNIPAVLLEKSIRDVLSMKDLTSAAASAGALDQPFRRETIFRDPADRMTFIRDLLPTVPVQDGSIEIIRETFTNNAGPQAATGTGTGLGAGEFERKNKSNISYELEDVKIRTMAHFIPASRQILADAPRLRAEIDGRLAYGLLLESDEQLLFGDGTGQNLTGIMVDSGVTDIGELAAGLTGDDLAAAMIDKVRAAVTQCQINEYRNINGLVINPLDWEQIETAKASDGHYIWVNVATGGGTQLWRVPVIVTNAQNEDEFVLGDWTMGATLYDREQVSVRVSEHHEDFFVKNAVAILAEERIGFGIHRPLAFTKGKFSSPSA